MLIQLRKDEAARPHFESTAAENHWLRREARGKCPYID